MWSLKENRIMKKKNGKEKWDVKIIVFSDWKEEETIENKSPTVTKVNIHEFKARTTMYWNRHRGEARNHVQKIG
jgi:hypothetical protein